MAKDTGKHSGHMTNKRTLSKNTKTHSKKQTYRSKTTKENKE